MNPDSSHNDVRPRWWKPALLGGIIAAAFVAALVLDVEEQIEQARERIASLGPWGPAAFILLYIAATVAAAPGAALTIAAGGLFGSVRGIVYVSLGSTIGAVICFLIARYLARDTVRRWIQHREAFRKIDRLTETHGWAVVAGLRLAPLVPYNLLNYGLGLTRVRFWTYVFWSWLGMLPGTTVYVVGADALVRGLREGRVPWRLAGVVAAGMTVLAAAGWYAKRRLDERSAESGTGGPSAAES